ncbi:MAG: tRNA lysidine(34) synthetase TilS [Dactylosporangium sp.]|nr:tRNA lysidine(34) synthetase TilS [Dactylosporangium sp.]NNJ63238.1 tRNA lysidine(34) synthetase TilS [Dactylosporangium sp.]
MRVAIRRCLIRQVGNGPRLVLVACSGGADSLALALATRFVAPRLGLGCGLVTVDHQLQEGSGQRAANIISWAERVGFGPVLGLTVDAQAGPGGQGPEATARTARYAAMVDAARRAGAGAVLLGHTREDQAETVLLALARGSGPRGLAGMPERRLIDGVPFLRPLLAVSRAQTRAACAAGAAGDGDAAGGVGGLEPWEDPHNADPAFARVRVRQALPVLVEALGAGVVANLARTAQMIAVDVEYLDAAAASAAERVSTAGGALSASGLAELPTALRRRVLHQWSLGLGARGADLSSRHVDALDALVTAWRGQGHVALPGGIRVGRETGRLAAVPPPGTTVR